MKKPLEANLENARYYCRFAIRRGGIPFAPHLLFTQLLDDSIPREREQGLELGIIMLSICDELWAFGEPTAGMALEISEAERLNIPVRRFNALGGEVTCDE